MPSSGPEREKGDIFSNGGEWKRRSHQLPQTTWPPQPSSHLCSKQTLVAGPQMKRFHCRVLHILVLCKSGCQQRQYFGLTLESSGLPKKAPMQIPQPLRAVSETILFFKAKQFERMKKRFKSKVTI